MQDAFHTEGSQGGQSSKLVELIEARAGTHDLVVVWTRLFLSAITREHLERKKGLDNRDHHHSAETFARMAIRPSKAVVFLLSFFTFRLWIGAVVAIFAWSAARYTISKYGRLRRDIRRHVVPTVMVVARTVYTHVLVPSAHFVSSVFQEVERNMSAPVASPDEGDEGVDTRGENEETVNNASLTDPRQQPLTRLLGRLISSALTSLLALAYEVAKSLQFIITSRGSPTTPMRMDIYDEAELNLTTLEIDTPGMTKDEIKISVFEGVLSISYEAPLALDSKPSRFYRQRERQYGHLTRVMKLPSGTKPVDLKANMDHGVLTIKFPTNSTRQPENINIVSTE